MWTNSGTPYGDSDAKTSIDWPPERNMVVFYLTLTGEP
jgi:hypothetical protein